MKKRKKFSENFEIEKTYDDLDEIDKTLIRLQLEKPSVSVTDLAKELKISYPTAWTRVNNPDYKRILNNLMDEPLRILMNGRTLAAQKLIDIIKDGKYPESYAAAKTLLFGTGTIVDRRFSNVNIQNDARSISYIISSDFMPALTPEQKKEAGILEELETVADEN